MRYREKQHYFAKIVCITQIARVPLERNWYILPENNKQNHNPAYVPVRKPSLCKRVCLSSNLPLSCLLLYARADFMTADGLRNKKTMLETYK